MKKAAGTILKILLGIILVILIVLFTVPLIFKDKIRIKVEQVIDKSLKAKVKFDDYNLGFFRNFPNLTFTLDGVSVIGIDRFQNDTLAGFKSFNLVFNLSSLLVKSGYEIKSIIIDRAAVNAIVLKDGTANWDITKSTSSAATVNAPATAPAHSPAPASSSGSPVKILLRHLEIRNSSVSYLDSTTLLDAKIKDLNFILAGSINFKETLAKMALSAGEATITMNGIKYLNKAKIDSKINMLAELDSMKFTMRDNYFSVNDLKLSLSGSVSMPGKDIKTDLVFGTNKESLKTLMSLIPAAYMTGYQDLKASGEASLSGTIKGTYSAADSSMPNLNLNFNVSNGLISYPSLPEKLSNISINANVFFDGKVTDRSTVNLEKLHFELSGSPFDMTLFVKTPVSDPDIKASMNGKIDLNALSKALPMKGITLSGLIDMALSLEGKLSMIEKAQYEKFAAKGSVGIRNMIYSITGYPRVEIKDASLLFTPASIQLKNSEIIIERTSDYTITGNLENYLPYFFKNKTLKANLSVHSNFTDISSIMKGMTDTTKATSVKDTAGLVIPVPRNINLDCNALIEKLSYDKIKPEKVKAHIIAKDGILSLHDAGMNILGGTILMNADYDTRDAHKPSMKADFDARNIGIRDAFNTFLTVQKFAPATKSIDGRINAKLAYQSLLGKDMMPVMNSINGEGKIQSDQITLLESPTFDKMKTILKLGEKYNGTFKDININFKITDGRIYVSPFDVKTGNLKMNVSGDQGLDQTINYIVKTEIPRTELGSSVNSFIDNISSQAASFGINFKPSELLRVNLRVSGTFSKPEVAPFFGNASGAGTGGVKETAKEAVKQTTGNAPGLSKPKTRAEADAEGTRQIKEAQDKGQQLRDEAAKSADQIRSEADSQGKNLIDAASSKGTIAKIAAQKSAEALKKAADKKAEQLIQDADNKANKLVEDAKTNKEEMMKKF
jgi:hypothetical protein